MPVAGCRGLFAFTQDNGGNNDKPRTELAGFAGEKEVSSDGAGMTQSEATSRVCSQPLERPDCMGLSSDTGLPGSPLDLRRRARYDFDSTVGSRETVRFGFSRPVRRLGELPDKIDEPTWVERRSLSVHRDGCCGSSGRRPQRTGPSLGIGRIFSSLAARRRKPSACGVFRGLSRAISLPVKRAPSGERLLPHLRAS
jgi:hypothetical protein